VLTGGRSPPSSPTREVRFDSIVKCVLVLHAAAIEEEAKPVSSTAEFDDRESLAWIFVDGGVIRLELRRAALRVALTGCHSNVSALGTKFEPPVPSIMLLTGGQSKASSPTGELASNRHPLRPDPVADRRSVEGFFADRRARFESTPAAPRARC
jgi:hypothetical protein